MKKNIKNIIILVLIIEIVGLGLIFYQSSLERAKVRKEREKYYIVTDINNNDVLKIEKKYQLLTQTEFFRFSTKFQMA